MCIRHWISLNPFYELFITNYMMPTMPELTRVCINLNLNHTISSKCLLFILSLLDPYMLESFEILTGGWDSYDVAVIKRLMRFSKLRVLWIDGNAYSTSCFWGLKSSWVKSIAKKMPELTNFFIRSYGEFSFKLDSIAPILENGKLKIFKYFI